MNKNTVDQAHTTPLPTREGQGGGSVLASLIFFTRLPWWRLCSVPKEAFEHVVDYWPFVGWLTGALMAGVGCLALWLGLTPMVAVLVAIGARLLLTGALHEDGLADFCDGFGGGTTRERTLAIMKDSHIGTYGVIGLIFYFGFLALSMEQIVSELTFCSVDDATGAGAMMLPAFSLLMFFDVLAKVSASMVTGQLPYARTAEGAKNQVVYAGRTMGQWCWHAFRCTLALALPVFLCVWAALPQVLWLLPVPFVTELLLVHWMRVRIGGYTGDCCGALFLLCELSLYLAFPIFFSFV